MPLPGFVEDALDLALHRALQVQRPVVLGYVNRVRDRHRDADPAALLKGLERRYLAAVGGIGAASGTAAAVPGIGTATAVATAALEIAAFTEATALYTLAVAEVYGVDTTDPELRRALVLAVLLGDGGVALGEVAAGRGWGQIIGRRGSEETISKVNNTLAKHVFTRVAPAQSALALGRALPMGIGAGIGAAGNLALGRGAVKASRRLFSQPPRELPPRIVDGTVIEGPPPDRPQLEN
jgi:hypothetical protein